MSVDRLHHCQNPNARTHTYTRTTHTHTHTHTHTNTNTHIHTHSQQIPHWYYTHTHTGDTPLLLQTPTTAAHYSRGTTVRQLSPISRMFHSDGVCECVCAGMCLR